MDRSLEDRYEFELASGYSTLERVGDFEYRTDPNLQFEDDPYTALFEDAVYGGDVRPDEQQHFYVYDVEWSEDLDAPEPPQLEELGEELDSVFAGWIVNRDGERVFALEPGQD